ncbi:MAG: cytochrome oxidase subunit III [Bacteroidia bacterium]|nr:cytochrome oxidase subunit III [Bacteroidia bacterium]MCO5252916.1 cytochrome oxidase subunit III [Bacteroidota bacterium]
MSEKITNINPSNIQNTREDKSSFGVHPVVFLVWLLIIASIMLFSGFISAYIVQRTDGLRNEAWLQFQLPICFWVSAGIAVVSSFLMQKAYNSARKDDVQLVPSLVFLAIITGLMFGISQFLGWKDMTSRGLFISNQEPEEISASFVYVISLVHLAHILIGLALLIITFYKSLKLKVHRKDLVFINISTTYWHFLGLLWICILLFLYFAR